MQVHLCVLFEVEGRNTLAQGICGLMYQDERNISFPSLGDLDNCPFPAYFTSQVEFTIKKTSETEVDFNVKKNNSL